VGRFEQRASDFHSLDELLDFIAGILTGVSIPE
jgi:hypothetical protein